MTDLFSPQKDNLRTLSGRVSVNRLNGISEGKDKLLFILNDRWIISRFLLEMLRANKANSVTL